MNQKIHNYQKHRLPTKTCRRYPKTVSPRSSTWEIYFGTDSQADLSSGIIRPILKSNKVSKKKMSSSVEIGLLLPGLRKQSNLIQT